MSKILSSTLSQFVLRNLQRSLKLSGTTMSSLMTSGEKWFNKYEEVTLTVDGVFRGVSDRFNGITVDSRDEQVLETKKFDEMLSKSIDHWTENKKRGIWFKVHNQDAPWVPILAKHNFYFHHAKDTRETDTNFVMMYRWLPKDETLIIPPFAHTMIGVGALVINDKNEVLVVSEKNSLIKSSWKLPGGYVEPNENLVDAAIREVLEETNIQTKFESLISLRHAHGGGFNCSDLYIVMSLIPLSTEIKKCDREIAKCEWMDVDAYLKNQHVHQTNRSFLQTYLDNKKAGIKICVQEDMHQMLKKKYNLYFATTDLKPKM